MAKEVLNELGKSLGEVADKVKDYANSESGQKLKAELGNAAKEVGGSLKELGADVKDAFTKKKDDKAE